MVEYVSISIPQPIYRRVRELARLRNRYDTAYDPAMPAADIQIGRAMVETSLALTALVDSGADATMIPIHYLQQIRARRSRKKWMQVLLGSGCW